MSERNRSDRGLEAQKKGGKQKLLRNKKRPKRDFRVFAEVCPAGT